jgi:glycosyltransferase involved in cell wall biosynthesis
VKIIQSCGSSSWGGLEMMALQTSKELTKLGHDVFLFCKKNSKLYEEGNKSGINCLEIFDNDRNTLRNVNKIKKLIGKQNLDIVHTHLSHDLWTLVPALRGTNIKLYLTKHMGSYIKKKDILHKYLYNKVNGILAVSNYVKESLLNTCPVKSEKIHILPDYINLNKFEKNNLIKEETKNENNISKNAFIIGMAGRISPGKGHEDFINAAKIVTEKINKDIIFLVIGSASYGEEEYEKKIKSLAVDSGMKNKIVFIQHTKDISRLLNIIDIFIMPSHEESFGIVLLEAMAMELPVIATGNAGAKDIVVNNETGVLIEPKNPELLATTLIDFINSPDKIKNYGKNGRKRVEENFSSERIISKLVDYYNTI